MADPRFHDRKGPFTLAQLAQHCEATLHDPSQGGIEIADVAALDVAGTGQLTFLDNAKYKEQFLATKAGACIVSPDLVELAPKGVALLVSKQTYRSYALVARMFYPPVASGIIDDTARIHETAKIGKNCTIEAYTVIGPGVVLGDNCHIGNNVSISHTLAGDGVRIHNGARIGQEGFGFALGPKGHLPVPQLGRVIIGDFANIGANTTIDRGSGPDTEIGAGSIIDNLVQIAHNVKVGRGCVIVAQVGIAGSTQLGDFVVMGGQAGIAGHLNIGTGARIAAQSGVTKNIPAGEEWLGFPATPKREFWKQHAMLKKLLSKPAQGR